MQNTEFFGLYRNSYIRCDVTPTSRMYEIWILLLLLSNVPPFIKEHSIKTGKISNWFVKSDLILLKLLWLYLTVLKTNASDVEKCQTEGFDWHNFIRTDKDLIFLLHILLFGLTRFSKSVQMTGMSKKISTSLLMLWICVSIIINMPVLLFCEITPSKLAGNFWQKISENKKILLIKLSFNSCIGQR